MLCLKKQNNRYSSNDKQTKSIYNMRFIIKWTIKISIKIKRDFIVLKWFKIKLVISFLIKF